MKVFVIAKKEFKEYWTGKKYIHQGEEFLVFDKNSWKAKQWQSKKRAETAFNKLPVSDKESLEILEWTIGVVTSGEGRLERDSF